MSFGQTNFSSARKCIPNSKSKSFEISLESLRINSKGHSAHLLDAKGEDHCLIHKSSYEKNHYSIYTIIIFKKRNRNINIMKHMEVSFVTST